MIAERQLTPESLVARIIAEMEANPDAQRLLLRAMLTNEFLGVPARLDRIEKDVAELKTDVGALKGSDLEMKVHRRIRPLLSQSLQVRRTRIIQSAVHQAPDDFSEAIATAADEKRISWDQEQRITATDIIVRAQRQSDRAPVWIAVEVANRLDVDDLTRSRTSADTLAAVFGEDGVAVVVGHRIDAADRERADAAGVRYLEVPERVLTS